MTFQEWLAAGKSHKPFEGRYVLLTCCQQYRHEDDVKGLSLSVDKETAQDRLTYTCPECKMPHASLLEG